MLDLKTIETISYTKTFKWGFKKMNELKHTLIASARSWCPVDTGNMRENAIYVVNTPTGFKIVWDDKFAFYMPDVNEGRNKLYPNSIRVKQNKGFVDRGIGACFVALNAVCSYGKLEFQPMRDGRSKRFAPLFLKLQHKLINGQLSDTYMVNNERMLERLSQSMKYAMLHLTDPSKDLFEQGQEIFDVINEEVREAPIGIVNGPGVIYQGTNEE